MNYLLDSHVFLWLNDDPEKLSEKVLSLCRNMDNVLSLSHITPWEIQIKQQIGKLKLDNLIGNMIKLQQDENQLQLLPIELKHIYELETLPQFHRDPFDRLLIAQAKSESMILISADQKIKQYDLEVFW